SAGVESQHLVRRGALRGEHDDRGGCGERVRPYPPGQLHAVDVGHHQVHDHQRGLPFLDDVQRAAPVVGEYDVIALELQVHLDEAGDVMVVVDDEQQVLAYRRITHG